MKKLVAIAAAALCMAATSNHVSAQVRNNYVGLNPIGIVFQWYTLEAEHSLGSVSIGLTGNYIDLGGGSDFSEDEVLKYNSFDVKLRYYPEERGLKGFSLGVSAGYSELRGAFTDDAGQHSDHAGSFTTGVLVDYNWILGAKQRVLIGTGIGAKRLWGLDTDIAPGYPTARLTVGFAF